LIDESQIGVFRISYRKEAAAELETAPSSSNKNNLF